MNKPLISLIKFLFGLAALCISLWFLGETVMASDSESDVSQEQANIQVIENGKIVEAQNFLSDQHQADEFFWRVYPLKPLPDRLAQ